MPNTDENNKTTDIGRNGSDGAQYGGDDQLLMSDAYFDTIDHNAEKKQ